MIFSNFVYNGDEHQIVWYSSTLKQEWHSLSAIPYSNNLKIITYDNAWWQHANSK